MKLIDLHKQTATVSSAATIALGAAATGFRTLAQAMAAGDLAVGDKSLAVFVRDLATGAFESGLYTVTNATTLTREAITSSSNNGAAVAFGGAAVEVYSSAPAALVNNLASVRDITFSQSVPLTMLGTAYMPQYTVTGALAFTPAAGAVKGAFAYGGIIADGASAVTFPGFKQAIGSADYDNRAGILNVLEFSYDGYNYWYAVSQAVGAVPVDVVAPTITGAAVANSTPTIVTLAASEALDPNNTPAASAFAVTGHTVTGVAVAGTVVNLTVSAGFANGEAARTVSYTQPGSAGLRDQAQNLMLSFGPLSITNNVQPVDLAAPTVSSAQVAAATPAIIQVTMNENLAASVPPASAFAVSGGKTVSSVSISGAVVSLTCSAAYVNGDTITVTYTQPSGNPRLQDAAGNVTASFGPVGVTNNVQAPGAAPRYTNLAFLTEGGTAPNYTYTGGAHAYDGTAQGGVSNLALQSGVDGWLSQTISSIGTCEPMLGVLPGTSPLAYASIPYILWAAGGTGGYKVFTNGSQPTPTTPGIVAAAGDIMRMRRVGTNLIGEVSKDSGVTWTTIYTWTGVSSGVLHFQGVMGGAPTPGVLSNLASSGLA